MSKRGDVLRGALEVFARDGYTRAGIDAIASTAGVSTRTIYNQFGDKAGLFSATIQHSAEAVATRHVEIIRRHLGKILDLEEDLVAFGIELVTPLPEFTSHFALVLQINAERGHIPSEALDAWHAAGPMRVQGVLADHLRQMADRGLLQIDDADLAAGQLARLVGGEVNARGGHGATPLADDEIRRLVVAGVRTFLYGFAPGR